MKSEQRNRIHFLEKKLRKLINSWKLIPGCPSDEFDMLNHRILSVLLNQKEKTKLKGIIESYIVVDLGLYTNDNDIEAKFQAILDWWKNESM